MLDYDRIKSWPIEDVVLRYGERDTILYALAVGLGSDPTDERELRFVYENQLQAVPTMAAALAWPRSWMRDPASGVDYLKVVHGEEDVRLHRTLPAAATIRSRTHVTLACDKGAAKGAIVEQTRDIVDAATDEPIAQVRQVAFLRGDGGFSERSGKSDPPPETLPAVPARAADIEVTVASIAQAALIYRLCGDDNPLHVDPAVAAKAGFARPILHGLGTFGMAAVAVLRACCDYDASRIRRMATRFTAPVYPGESVRFELWRDGPGRLQLRARVEARDAVVLNNGVVELE